MEIYFDNAATTMVCKEAADAALNAMTMAYGNPSSLHNKGLEAEKIMRRSRESVAALWGVRPEEIYFTSCATESNNLALSGAIKKGLKWGNTVITTKAEHPSVLEVFENLKKEFDFKLIYINLLKNGQPDTEMLKRCLDDKIILISMMHVNNETGCIMPVREAVNMVKKASPRAFAHSDMVQSYGKTGVSPKELGVDFASISGHKIHAPKGIGALYIKSGVSIKTGIFGGGQEKNFRSGTENVPGVAALGAASEKAMVEREETNKKTAEIKKYISDSVLSGLDGCFTNGENAVSNILNITFTGLRSEILLHSLEAKGIFVSSGSACSSNHPSPSKALTAMGLKTNEIDGSLRFSFSGYNTLDEAKYAVKVLLEEVPKIRKFYRG